MVSLLTIIDISIINYSTILIFVGYIYNSRYKGGKINGYNVGLSENVVYPEKPNGFADHYPY